MYVYLLYWCYLLSPYMYCRCWAISFFLEKMPLKWIINHQLTFLMALLFVLHDLSNEVSFGVGGAVGVVTMYLLFPRYRRVPHYRHIT